MSAEVKTARRMYLLKSQALSDVGQDGLAGLYRYKQEQQVSPELPADFPLRAELVAARYSTTADVDGADVAELRLRAGLTTSQAEAVIAAAAAL